MSISYCASLCLALWLLKGYYSAFPKSMSVNAEIHVACTKSERYVMHGAGDYERNLRKFANFQRQISRKSHRLASTINNETDKLSACSCARPRNPPFIDLPLTIMKSLMPVILTQALC